MLIYSINVSADGFIADRNGEFAWTEPSEELFAFHLARIRAVRLHLCGRRLYETMLVWETDPTLRDTALGAEFAAVWTALPKVVFSRTLHTVSGNARLARTALADEIAAARTRSPHPGIGGDVEIGGAALAGAAIRLGLVDELRTFRIPILVGGGTPHLPPLSDRVALELLETRTFDGGVTYERHRIVRPDADR